jgi:hypothetical protein
LSKDTCRANLERDLRLFRLIFESSLSCCGGVLKREAAGGSGSFGGFIVPMHGTPPATQAAPTSKAGTALSVRGRIAFASDAVGAAAEKDAG